MCFSRKKKEPEIFVEDPVEERFDAMMNLVRDLTRKDYNKLKKAMDSGYEAYQIVRGIDGVDDANEPAAEPEFLLHPDEGK
ncbi:hypothetical protein IJJ05_02970 [Candidatus Saccharibacteria bacterium]|nr:hypothetical protein [Candidatus Saccharibacteria bacterium]